ncbi:cytochrome P450 2C16-like [Diadema antillarum]|uniref:cytochrome P450 2C16-like n=1 Tax=Diadema antillarum TaxID=105358 RepID=UPI003A86C197
MESPVGSTDFSYVTAGTAAVALALLAALVFNRRTLKKTAGNPSAVYSLPPGPPGWPLLGNIPGMILAGSGSKYLAGLVEKYGTAFTMYMGSRPVLVLNTYPVMKDALLDGHLLSNRGSLPALDDYFKGRGVIGSQYTDYWKKTRSFVIQALKHFGVNRQCFEGVVASQADHLVDYLHKTFDEEPCDPLQTLQASVANVMNGVVFAKQYDYEDSHFIHLLQLVHGSLRAIEYAAVSSLVPGLHYLPGCSYKGFYSKMDKLMEFFREQIKEHDETLDPENPRDVIDVYLIEVRRTAKDPTENYIFTKSNLEFVVNDLFMAGFETTANVLYWAILLVASHPEVQERLHEEADAVIGQNGYAAMSDRQSMPYTMATLEEAIRYASVAISSIRSSTSDMKVAGHLIEPDTWVMLNYEYCSFDPETWSDPLSFKPERFLNGQGEFQPREELISFSIGKRNCLGERLARMELFLFFTNILQNYDLVFPPDAPAPPIEAQNGGMTRIPHHYKVSFKKRSSSRLSSET